MYKAYKEDYEMDCGSAGVTPTKLGLAKHIVEMCWYVHVNPKICKLFGHNNKNYGYANGNSGHDHIVCDRCGKEFTHIYY